MNFYITKINIIKIIILIILKFSACLIHFGILQWSFKYPVLFCLYNYLIYFSLKYFIRYYFIFTY